MNTSSSDFTSGCESGWTQYFDKSSTSSHKSPQTGNMKMKCEDYFEQDYRHNCYEGCEDLSMVSDASSGPRQYNDVVEECFDHRNDDCSPEIKLKKKNRNGKVREKSMTQLDDTASSHSKSKQTSMYYNNNLNGHETSATSLTKGRSSRKKYFGL